MNALHRIVALFHRNKSVSAKPNSKRQLRLESLEERQLLSVSPLNVSVFSDFAETSNVSEPSANENDDYLRLLADFQTGNSTDLPGEPVVLPPQRTHGTIKPLQFVNVSSLAPSSPAGHSSAPSGGGSPGGSSSGGGSSGGGSSGGGSCPTCFNDLTVSISQTGSDSIYEWYHCGTDDADDCEHSAEEKYPLIRVTASGHGTASVKIALTGTAVHGEDYILASKGALSGGTGASGGTGVSGGGTGVSGGGLGTPLPVVSVNGVDTLTVSGFLNLQGFSGGSDVFGEFYVVPLNNADPNDGDRTVEFTIQEVFNTVTGSGGCGHPLYTIGNATAEVEIKDDDDWTVSLSGGGNLNESTQLQGTQYQYLALSRTGGLDLSYGINVSLVCSGKAKYGQDYVFVVEECYPDQRIPATTQFVLPAGATSLSFVMEAVDDSVVERRNESYSISIGSAGIYKKSGTASGFIVDKDELKLEAVQFEDHLGMIPDPGDTWAVKQSPVPLIDISKPYDWQEQGSQYIRPVAYSCGSFNNNLKCSAAILGQVASEYEGQVRFVWSGGGASGTSDWVDLSSTVVTAELEATFAEIFGKQQSYYNSSTTLTWEYRIDDEEHGIAGVSTNPIYVTYDDPLPDTLLYHTVVHTGCIAANGIGGTEQAVFDAVWSKFESLSIPKVKVINGQVTEQETLTYYGRPNSILSDVMINLIFLEIEIENGIIQSPTQLPTKAREIFGRYTTTTGLLLRHLDGTCGAWQYFSSDVFAAQGIQVSREDIVVDSDIEAFKVKSDATGQGTDNPKESIWADHAVIEYDGNVYDPSYGVEYGGKADALFHFMELSVESVGVYLVSPPAGVDTRGYGRVYESLGYLDYTKAEYYFRWD